MVEISQTEGPKNWTPAVEKHPEQKNLRASADHFILENSRRGVESSEAILNRLEEGSYDGELTEYLNRRLVNADGENSKFIGSNNLKTVRRKIEALGKEARKDLDDEKVKFAKWGGPRQVAEMSGKAFEANRLRGRKRKKQGL